MTQNRLTGSIRSAPVRLVAVRSTVQGVRGVKLRGRYRLKHNYEQRLTALAAQGGAGVIAGGRRGLEKECLRITPAGLVAQSPHPAKMGAALTNSFITTDYSEALLEFVTPPQDSSWAAHQFLCDVHHFVYSELGEELLWPLSMPCRIRSEDDIPIACYGDSNVGRMKSIYRQGLGNRYGRYMQAIAGIHFNYSVPELFWSAWAGMAGKPDSAALRSEYYLGLVRNVRRIDWLILYLFGASPAICRSFLAGVKASLEPLDADTSYGPWATSLRMSDLGYQNRNQSVLVVSANSLDEYIRDLSAAIVRPNAEYQRLGLQRDGEYLQLNVNDLQIENEYYSTIRPKRVAQSGERPTAALRRGGIEYVEFRALDLNPFEPIGIGQGQQKFLEAFLLYCLVQPSPPIDATEQAAIHANSLDIARRGREPGLHLRRNGESVRRDAWAARICADMQPLCRMLDAGDEQGYSAALEHALASVHEPELTPSARLLAELSQSGTSFADYGLRLANDYQNYFSAIGEDFNSNLALLRAESASSHVRQRAIEGADELSLDDYIARYYAG